MTCIWFTHQLGLCFWVTIVSLTTNANHHAPLGLSRLGYVSCSPQLRSQDFLTALYGRQEIQEAPGSRLMQSVYSTAFSCLCVRGLFVDTRADDRRTLVNLF